MTDFNNFNDDIKIYNLEPYVLISGLTGTTKYTGISLLSGDVNKPIWKIKKEWQCNNSQFMGFPDGRQAYEYIWSCALTYNYF